MVDDKAGERLAKLLGDPDRAQRVESIGEGMREAKSTDEMQPIPCGFGELPKRLLVGDLFDDGVLLRDGHPWSGPAAVRRRCVNAVMPTRANSRG